MMGLYGKYRIPRSAGLLSTVTSCQPMIMSNNNYPTISIDRVIALTVFRVLLGIYDAFI
jgi:hypothetical protein